MHLFKINKNLTTITNTKRKAGKMETTKDIFDIFLEDESYKYIMKRLLEASMEESFNSIVITEAGPGYPIIYVNAAFCELSGYGPHEVMGKSPSLLQGPNTDPEVLKRLNQNIADGVLFHGQAINYRRDEIREFPLVGGEACGWPGWQQS